MSLRLFWRRIHLWIGAACGLFLLIMGLSGTVLLFGPNADRALHPALYDVTGPAAGQPADVYLAKAKAAAPGAKPVQLRWPEQAGQPLTVLMRFKDDRGQHGTNLKDAPEDRADRPTTDRHASGRNGAEAPPAPMLIVYLDPPTGAVLGTAEPRASIMGFVRSLHESLLLPAFGGRWIVGWSGAGLLILCLTGVCLWWPRHAGLLRGLRWRRGPSTSLNLHHRIGFWIALPLAVMAFTGIFQAFQQQGRAVMGVMAAVSPQPMRQGPGGAPLGKSNLEPQQVVDAALADSAGAHPAALAFPTEANQSWRVQFTTAGGEAKTILIDDATKALSAPQALRGDTLLAFMRRIHEGRHEGPIWQMVVLFAGLSPPLLFVTGVLMWLRRRRYVAAPRQGDSMAAISKRAFDQDQFAA